MLLISCIVHNRLDSVGILSRENWKTDNFLMGNRMPILACEFNPVIYHNDEGSNKTKKISDEISIYCALGGCDSTLSIWRIDKDKPMVVIKNIVKSRITDLCWAQNGYNLYISGSSGEVIVLSFTTKEFGTPFTPREKELYITNHFGPIYCSSNEGSSLNGMYNSVSKSGGSSLNLPENIDLLGLMDKGKKVFFYYV